MKKIPNLFSVLFICTLLLAGCKSPEASKEETVTTTPQPDTTAITQQPPAQTAVDTTFVDTNPKKAPLTLVFRNLSSPTAPIMVGVYNDVAKFPKPSFEFKTYKFVPNGKELTVDIKDLDLGDYAIAVYQDKNSNGKIDKNVLGIPTEPYAFSNNYKPTVKAPAFKDCKFQYTAKGDTVSMKMLN